MEIFNNVIFFIVIFSLTTGFFIEKIIDRTIDRK